MTKRTWLISAVCVALASPAVVFAPAYADDSRGADTTGGSADGHRPDLSSTASGIRLPTSKDPSPEGADPASESRQDHSRIETLRRERPVAPGVTLESFDAYGPDPHTGTPNWLRGDSMTVDLTAGTTVDYLFPGRVADGEPVSTMAQDAGAVAAVNGDFFDIDRSNAPLGAGVRDGEPVQSPDATDDRWHSSVAMITPDGLGEIGEVFFSGTVRLPGERAVELDGLNKPYAARDQVHTYTPAWGSHCRCTATEGADQVVEVEVVNDSVTAIREQASDAPIPSDGFVLVGRESGARALAELEKGDRVAIDYQVRGPEQTKLHAAINGRQPLVVDGEPVSSSEPDNETHPRTAVGFSEDGREMYLLTVDGRQPSFATGVGLDELAAMMAELGAHNAINLDGGGSSTIVARRPGSDQVRLENSPSDGEQRPDPNGLGLFAPEGSGKLKDIRVRTALDPREAAGATDIGPARTERVFPGFTRELVADGHDETFGPAEANPRWRSGDKRVGRVTENGIFRAESPGETTVVASDGGARGRFGLTVLDDLDHLGVSTEQVALAGPGDTQTFSVLGYDEHGHSAPFEPYELLLSYDRDLIDIEQTEHGTFRAKALTDDGTAMVTVSAGDVETVVPVTIGFDEVSVSDFEDPSEWQFHGERADGRIEQTEGRQGNGLRLSYDFAASDDTRTAGVLPTNELRIPGKPRAFGLWVRSTGNGELPSLEVRDASGALLPAMRGTNLTDQGWQRVEFDVPEDVVYPLTFERYYSAETESDHLYQGDIVLDELTALVPPDIHRPGNDEPPRSTGSKPDEELREQAPQRSGHDSHWNVAEVSDADISAPDGSGDGRGEVRQLTRTLRDIRRSDADLVLVNGDLVAEGTTRNLRFAERLLDKELGDELPYVYLPGDQERSAGGTLDAFQRIFDDQPAVFDHRGTRFVTLDTSEGSLRDSDWSQLPMVRKELDRVASDQQIRSVVLVSHRPMFDPERHGLDGLIDRKEARTLSDWLAGFRRDTGKGVALLGAHAGEFAVTPTDGMPSFVNGPVTGHEQSPTAPKHGWSLLHADRVAAAEAAKVRANPWRGGPDWISAEFHASPDTAGGQRR